MTRLTFFNTFRGRLLFVLAILLVATLGVQYYLNLRVERENAERRALQLKTLVTGITVGVNAIASSDLLNEFKEKQSYFQPYRDRIEDVLIINNKWEIYDSFNPDYLYTRDANGKKQYKSLSELKNLPPLQDVESLGEDVSRFPNASAGRKTNANDGEAHAIPFETTEGRWYIMVILKSEEGLAARRAAQTLIYPLGVLLTAILAAIILVWRFTRPIKNLSDAARRVAEGDLKTRLADANRTDEIGNLAAQFNEMIGELEKTRCLEAQLREAEKSAVIGRLGSAIAHEIRNPLNYINLTLDHLRAKFSPDDAEKAAAFAKLTAQLKTEVARINQQITDFLRYSRPLKLNPQPTEIGKVVEDSMRIVEAQAKEQNVAVEIAAPDAAAKVLGDAEALRSVFNNLFVNAVQAMPDGGSLTATISDNSDCIKVDIKDTGAGIAPENLEKIFEPYFSTKETGTGLGLAIVKRIVDEHQGSIEVVSRKSAGTTFTVKLPKA
jgi:signal transduction histidine kinase